MRRVILSREHNNSKILYKFNSKVWYWKQKGTVLDDQANFAQGSASTLKLFFTTTLTEEEISLPRPTTWSLETARQTFSTNIKNIRVNWLAYLERLLVGLPWKIRRSLILREFLLQMLLIKKWPFRQQYTASD